MGDVISQPAPTATDPAISFAGLMAGKPREYADLRSSPEALESGTWAVIAEFDGPWHAWRVDAVNVATPHRPVSTITREGAGEWTSSLTRAEFLAAVSATVGEIEAGRLAQVNLCRVLSRAVSARPVAGAFHAFLRGRHPAPYAGWWDLPPGGTGPGDPGAWVVSASPELAIEVGDGRIWGRPIKGTAAVPEGLLAKDHEENVLVANALARDFASICRPGSIDIEPGVLERHPGLVHLVARVSGTLAGPARPGAEDWAAVLAATQPPRSVAGVPRAASLDWIDRTETVPRGPYCGQMGWIDADAGRAVLAAGIRIFWLAGGQLRFGTGAGITAGSNPAGEWAETELKAGRLVALAEEFLAGAGEPDPTAATGATP